ncbi:membrane protein [Corynebacterium sphenisci DSM 44792]|uniref:Membrane protein n=1 Tax=Corynebacterium sphenisci DSM 44792 TaxID=1437874 RepID=A0A1L7CWH1_9CORY|nr:DUF3618 domain-containing protein [Corynebacterium sphenisci]APT90219.1 membrane protein [Corynebacterium sphenisci DSM 44792]
MARNIDAIQRDIERNRTQLARTLDELAERANPKSLADDAKSQAADRLKDPQVQAILGVCAAAVVGLIVAKVVSNRKRGAEIERIRELIENVSK